MRGGRRKTEQNLNKNENTKILLRNGKQINKKFIKINATRTKYTYN
jgi:hypothetical protein